MTSCPSIITVAFCSVSSTRGRWKTPFARRASSSFFKYVCSLSMLSFFPERCNIRLKRQDDFTAVTGFHDFHSVMNALKGQRMRNHLFEIELTRFEDAARAIPGIKDAPP